MNALPIASASKTRLNLCEALVRQKVRKTRLEAVGRRVWMLRVFQTSWRQ
jgi:hypothetical protein